MSCTREARVKETQDQAGLFSLKQGDIRAGQGGEPTELLAGVTTPRREEGELTELSFKLGGIRADQGGGPSKLLAGVTTPRREEDELTGLSFSVPTGKAGSRPV